MSVLLKRFLCITPNKPIFLKRYIDNVFMIWPRSYDLKYFLAGLNEFNPNIKFTSTVTNSSVNFLDITIYKDDNFHSTEKLNTTTYQKEANLYQYLHYDSNPPKSTFKGLIIGEATTYIRTNSTRDKYKEQVSKFIQRLTKRKYPLNFINSALKKMNYKKRDVYIRGHVNRIPQPVMRPIFKCRPPPNFNQLKEIILSKFEVYNLKQYFNRLFFISLKIVLLDCLVKSLHRATHRFRKNCKIEDFDCVS